MKNTSNFPVYKFEVTITGTWFHNGVRVTKKDVERDLRECLKDHYEFITERTSVKGIPK